LHHANQPFIDMVVERLLQLFLEVPRFVVFGLATLSIDRNKFILLLLMP
jgi:hypothetical protein